MSAKHALLVDDSKSARFALRQVLQRKGFEVDMAESAEVALEMVTQRQIDAIFMDHMMPGMDGYEATAILKSDPASAHIPVVMCTSNDQEEYVRKARETGAVGILPKPPTLEKLAEIMQLLEQEMAHNPVNQQQAAPTAAPAPAATSTSAPTPKSAPTPAPAAAVATSQDIDAMIRTQLPGQVRETVLPLIEQTVAECVEGVLQQLAAVQSEVTQARFNEDSIAPLVQRTVDERVEALGRQLATQRDQAAQAQPNENAIAAQIEQAVTERVEGLRQQLAAQQNETTQADSNEQATVSQTELHEDIATAVSALRAELTGNYQVYVDDQQRESADRVRTAVDERFGTLSQELTASVREQIESVKSDFSSNVEAQPLIDQAASAQTDNLADQVTEAVQEAKDTIAVAMLEQTNAQLDKKLHTVNRKVLLAGISGGLIASCFAMLFFVFFGG